METPIQSPVLVTLTAPTCGGKSYLYNYIRDVAKLPCLVSTTTRAQRVGEIAGIDYHYISQEKSEQMERDGQFAELAIYNGVRYGVTKEEFHNKLSQGIAFLIVEPGGIEHYAKPALDVGAKHYKAYVHTDPAIRFQRFRERAHADIAMAVGAGNFGKMLDTCLTRFQSMLTEEMQWGTAAQWDRVLFGTDEPAKNLAIILQDIEKIRKHDLEVKLSKIEPENNELEFITE